MNKNSPAFPCEQGICPSGRANETFQAGLTKREYFAAQALIGLTAHHGLRVENDSYARRAVSIANSLLSLLAELEKTNEPTEPRQP